MLFRSLVKPDKDISVELFQKEGAHKVLTAGYTPKFDFNIDFKKIPIYIEKPSLKNQTPLEEQFKNATGVNKSISIDNLINIEYRCPL